MWFGLVIDVNMIKSPFKKKKQKLNCGDCDHNKQNDELKTFASYTHITHSQLIWKSFIWLAFSIRKERSLFLMQNHVVFWVKQSLFKFSYYSMNSFQLFTRIFCLFIMY